MIISILRSRLTFLLIVIITSISNYHYYCTYPRMSDAQRQCIPAVLPKGHMIIIVMERVINILIILIIMSYN